MTEGKKRCDVCKIFISNTSAIIQRHEQSIRHKDNAKKLSNIKEKKVAKDKEKKKTTRVLKQIKEKGSRSYQNHISKDCNANSLRGQTSSEGIGDHFTMYGDWEHDTSSGYYYNQTNGCYYDPTSGFFYTDALGKWATLKEVLAAATKLSSEPIQNKPHSAKSSPLTSKSQTKSKSPSQNNQRHKNNVTKKLSKKVAKDKEKKKTARVLTLAQIEEKESIIYQNDTSTFQTSNEVTTDLSTMFGEWERDMSSGYYYNLTNGCYYDPNSGLYYPYDLGKWVTLKEALAAAPKLPSKSETESKSQPPSSVYINKRKRPEVMFEEEVTAMKAREVERKMVEEREKLGKLPIRLTYVRKKRKD